MITLYALSQGQLQKIDLQPGAPLPAGAVWVDVIEPSLEEEKYIEVKFDIDLPTRYEMDKIEVMSPFYEEKGVHYMTITVLDKFKNEHFYGTAITLILTASTFITLRYARPCSFSSFASRIMRLPTLCASPEIVLANLTDSLLNKIADTLEGIGNDLDELLKSVFEKTNSHNKIISSKRYNQIIKKIGYTGNLVSKNRESLMSINRMLIYFSQIDEARYSNKRDHRIRFKNLVREVHSLTEYANFLSQRNGFLLDAILGMISVEQNMIIKVFTVASAVFMPPTLIASIYGMNFKEMPELHLWFGYPMALLLIVISALLPYFFFRKKGWL